MMGRFIRFGLIAIGALLIALGIGYYSWIALLRWQEARSPSTEQVVVLRDGRKIPLTQPSPVPQAIPTPVSQGSVVSSRQMLAAPTSAPVPTSPILPPERIRIPKIDLDRPVVLADNDHLPQFRGVGWLFGSAVPGAVGNMVLFGHLGGENGVFERLHELAPGDEFIVATQGGDLHYRVQSMFETTPDDVSVLLPNDRAIATLITCSGPWNAALQTNERRLIVVARLIDQPV